VAGVYGLGPSGSPTLGVTRTDGETPCCCLDKENELLWIVLIRRSYLCVFFCCRMKC
jgi:hypothetical protein